LIHKLPTGEWAAICKYLFTTGIVVGLDESSYRIRWCYERQQEAGMALLTWDGRGDPPGNWIKVKGRLLDGTHVDHGRT
jgi:hypothetical protein